MKERSVMKISKIAYLAGLFDGEGSVMYKQYFENRKNRPNQSLVWRIRLEIAMTDKKTIKFIHDTLLVRTQKSKTRIQTPMALVDFFSWS